MILRPHRFGLKKPSQNKRVTLPLWIWLIIASALTYAEGGVPHADDTRTDPPSSRLETTASETQDASTSVPLIQGAQYPKTLLSSLRARSHFFAGRWEGIHIDGSPRLSESMKWKFCVTAQDFCYRVGESSYSNPNPATRPTRGDFSEAPHAFVLFTNSYAYDLVGRQRVLYDRMLTNSVLELRPDLLLLGVNAAPTQFFEKSRIRLIPLGTSLEERLKLRFALDPLNVEASSHERPSTMPIVISRDSKIEMVFDATRQAVVDICRRDRYGNGWRCAITKWSSNNLENAVPSEITAYRLVFGKEAKDEAPLSTALKFTPGDGGVEILEARQRLLEVAFFSTARNSLKLTADDAESKGGSFANLTEQVASAQRSFIKNEIDLGLKLWNSIDSKLNGTLDRQRLATVLGPDAAAAAFKAAGDPERAREAVSLFRKCIASCDKGEWRYAAPQLVLSWEKLRTQSLNADDQVFINEVFLKSLLSSKNVSAITMLLRRSQDCPSDSPSIRSALDAVLHNEFHLRAYADSNISFVLAAMIRGNYGSMATDCLSGISWSPDSLSDERELVNHLISSLEGGRALNADFSAASSNVIASYNSLRISPYHDDPSVIAAMFYLRGLAASQLMVLDPQVASQCISNTAAKPGGAAFWADTMMDLGISISQRAGSDLLMTVEGRLLPLADTYARQAGALNFCSDLLRFISVRLPPTAAMRRFRSALLQDAFRLADNDAARLASVSRMVNGALSDKNFTKARQFIAEFAPKLSDSKDIENISRLAESIERKEQEAKQFDAADREYEAQLQLAGRLQITEKLVSGAGAKSTSEDIAALNRMVLRMKQELSTVEAR